MHLLDNVPALAARMPVPDASKPTPQRAQENAQSYVKTTSPVVHGSILKVGGKVCPRISALRTFPAPCSRSPARGTRQRNLPQSVAGRKGLLLSSSVNLLLLRESLVDLDEEISLVGDLGEGRYGC